MRAWLLVGLTLLLFPTGALAEPLPDLPKVEHLKTDRDVDLYVVQRPHTGYVAHLIQFGTGPTNDLAGKQGAGTVALWTLGAGERGRDGMKKRRKYAAQYRTGASQGRFHIRWVSQPATIYTLWKELAGTLRRPAMPGDWLESIQVTLVTTYRDRNSDPADTARRVWRRLALGDHPAARADHGTPRTTAGLTRQDLLTRIKQFHARPMQVFVVGDGDPETIKNRLNREFRRFPPPETVPSVEPMPLPGGAAIVLVHREGLQQSYVVAGSAGNVGRDDPAAMLALEELLGASIWGRLDQRLRVMGGSTYGFSPSAEVIGDLQYLSFSGWVETASTVDAVNALKGSLEAVIGDEPPTAAEVDAATAGIETSFLLQLSSNNGCVEALRYLGALGRDPADPGGWIEALRGVSPESTAAAAKRLIDPNEFAIVVLGDANVLEGPLSTLGVDVRVIGR